MFRLLACIGVLALSLSACIVVPEHHRHGPPAYGPGYGYRSRYQYRYYPEVGVYYDINRSLYFYRDNGWRSSRELPRHIRVIGAPVVVDMDDDTPYNHYEEHRGMHQPIPRG